MYLRNFPTNGLSPSISASESGRTGGETRNGILLCCELVMYSMADVTTLSFSASINDLVV
jgi:hypothetical protein